MSNSRQFNRDLAPLVSTVEMTRSLVAYSVDYPAGQFLPPHRHPTAQLIYATRGVMTIVTEHGTWVVPPQRAVWVPPGVSHSIRMTGPVGMRTLYLERALVPEAPDECCVVSVGALMRELILRAIDFDEPVNADGPEARISGVLLDEIRAAPIAPLRLPTPRDPRLLRIYDALVEQPGDSRTLEEWARLAGASARTLARLFRRETGMSFGPWRQQLRLLRALERLACDEPVTRIALELGYDSPSSFIVMFRRALGTTPGRYFDRGT